jgi:hypothetical protein
VAVWFFARLKIAYLPGSESKGQGHCAAFNDDSALMRRDIEF